MQVIHRHKLENQIRKGFIMPSCTTAINNKKYKCPVNKKNYSKVSTETIIKQIKQPWKWIEKKQNYYFCDDPACDVIYFGQDNSIIKQSDLRTKVGLKDKSETAIICYCFGVTKNEVNRDPDIKKFVIEQIEKEACACGAMNPSGKCCLKNFPK